MILRSRGFVALFVVAVGAASAGLDAALAAQAFSFKTSYHDVKRDPDAIWQTKDLSALTNGVTIYEYSLTTASGDWLISQIWTADCDAATCPTRLIKIAPNGRRTIVADEMMHQIIPPDDPKFSSLGSSKEQAAFAQHPFELSEDGKTLINGADTFQIKGGVQ